ncbi:hypothetical protein HYH02_001199 [Chlamydomonas schloesseri]|uniref:Attractin/MKLN-like beta-propeller domain-containing protein n=1 Tax=Chlamydomonas schloesseri TaxID=2026947 RepID=A0A836BCW3_9CHLO|nr:hypothetical protein HYH02_001199 [Chlamydomonas schloesseri]|eukprot:KAG2454164.1 hypothetical protein HYH02_001199 [Chlamydomonas schloesseri]
MVKRLMTQVAALRNNRSGAAGDGAGLAASAPQLVTNLKAVLKPVAPSSGYGKAPTYPLLVPLSAGGGSWTPLGNLSDGSISGAPFQGRSDHGMVAYGKHVYVIGGYGATADGQEEVLTQVVRYDTETGVWEEVAPLPEPRCRFATALVGDAIYVISGTALTDFESGPSDTVLIYNLTADTWTSGPRLAVSRIDACAAALDGKVYVFGGFDATYASLRSVEVLDVGVAAAAPRGSSEYYWRLLPQDSWMTESRADCRAVTVTPPAPTRSPLNRSGGGGSGAAASPASSPATAAAAPVIVVAGGVQYLPNTNKSCDGLLWVNCYRVLSSVHVFDPRQASPAISSGTATSNSSTTTSAGPEAGGRGWRALAPMLWPRSDFGLAVLPGGRLLAAGGEWSNGAVFQLARQQVEELSGDWGVATAPGGGGSGSGGAGGGQGGVWVAKAPLPEARFRTELVYVGGGTAVILGGVPTCGRAPNARMAAADACHLKALGTGAVYHDDRHAAAATAAAWAQAALGNTAGIAEGEEGAGDAVDVVAALLPQLFAALYADAGEL